MADTESTMPPPPAPRPRRKWRRRLLWTAAVLVLLAGSVYLARGPIIRSVALAAAGSALNADVSADAVRAGMDGTLVILDGSLRAPGVRGPAGEVIAFDRLEADLDWSSLIWGPPVVRRIELDGPVVRISQSVDSGDLNVEPMLPSRRRDADGSGPGAGSGSTPAPRRAMVVPQIFLRDGVIEIGEHREVDGEPRYTALKRIEVSGEVERSPDERGASIISFREAATPDDAASRGPVSVTGRVSDDGIELFVEGVTISEWGADGVPTPVRTLFRQLDPQGNLETLTINYSYDGGYQATAEVSSVAINLPVKPRPMEDPQGNIIELPESERDRLLRMHDTRGTLTLTPEGLSAQLFGSLEELPYEVTLDVDGASLNAPLTLRMITRGFEVREAPAVFLFAPTTAQRRIADFSGPTGIVDAEVVLTRGEPIDGRPAPLEVRGEMQIREGTAAFHKFPYRFQDLVGSVTFTKNRVDIVGISGRAPSGATISATGFIAPLDEDANVLVDVRVENLPVDAELAAALGKRARIVDELFSRRRYDELLARKLIASPQLHRDANARLAELRAAGVESGDEFEALRSITAAPVFELGGRVSVAVEVRRDPGEIGVDDAEWFDVVRVDLDRAGLLPDAAPYPLIARGVTIVKSDDEAVVEGGYYEGLAGGRAVITAVADFRQLDRDDAPFVPTLDIEASDLPLGPLLFNAIPDKRAPGQEQSAGEMLDRMGLSGSVRGTIDVALTPELDTGYEIHLTTDNAASYPRGESAGETVRITGITGTVDIDQTGLSARLEGDVAPPDDAGGPHPAGRAALQAQLGFGDDDRPGDLAVTATARDLPAAAPVEHIIGVVAPEARSAIEELRQTYRPAGRLTLESVTSRIADSAAQTTITVTDAQGFEFDRAGGRVSADLQDGVVIVRPAAGDETAGTITTRGLVTTLRFDGVDDGTLHADGPLTTLFSAADAPLAIRLVGGRFESPLVRSFLDPLLSPRQLAMLADLRPAGLFDLTLALRPDGAPEPTWLPDGVLTPRRLTLQMPGQAVEFAAASGEVVIEPGGGRLRGVQLRAPEWTLGLEGVWLKSPDGTTALRTTMSLDAQRLAPDLRAALPVPLIEVLDQLAFEITGPVTADAVNLAMSFPEEGSGATRLNGSVRLTDGAFDVGVAVTECDAVLQFRFDRRDEVTPPDMELKALATSFKLGGVVMSNGRLRIVGGDEGNVYIPLVSADCHGGRLAASAVLRPIDPDRLELGRNYEANIRFSDVRFQPVLDDLARARGVQPEAESADDKARGVLDAHLSIGGVVGDVNSRRGRGLGTVGGGRVLNLPLLVPLIRVSNLQLPMNERLDYAVADFWIDGPLVSFDELSVSSSSVAIYGYGTALWPDMRLDLRFRPRNRARIPILSAVVQNIRDELVTAVVRGTLAEPDVTVQAFGATTRFLGRAMGQSATEQQKRLDQIESRAARQPLRRPDNATPVDGAN